MRQQVRDHRSELLAGWWGGFTVGGISGVKIFMLQMNPMTFPVEFALKMLGTIILSCLGGVFGMMARDFYTHWIKPRIKTFNPKKSIDGADNIQPEQHQETRP